MFLWFQAPYSFGALWTQPKPGVAPGCQYAREYAPALLPDPPPRAQPIFHLLSLSETTDYGLTAARCHVWNVKGVLGWGSRRHVHITAAVWLLRRRWRLPASAQGAARPARGGVE